MYLSTSCNYCVDNDWIQLVSASLKFIKPHKVFKNGSTGLVSSGVCLTSWGEGDSLALVGHPSSDGIEIKMPCGVDVLLHRPASHPNLSY